jgi:hypothetical protein
MEKYDKKLLTFCCWRRAESVVDGLLGIEGPVDLCRNRAKALLSPSVLLSLDPRSTKQPQKNSLGMVKMTDEIKK